MVAAPCTCSNKWIKLLGFVCSIFFVSFQLYHTHSSSLLWKDPLPEQDDALTVPLRQRTKTRRATNDEDQQRDTEAASYQSKETPMNVVLLYADDWSFHTLGAMGDRVIQTPVLDRLAEDGILFTHNCVTTSICMQSRASLYTGQYSSRHQTYFSWKDIHMYRKHVWKNTLYPLFMQNNYHTGFFGKYHHRPPPPFIPTFSDFRSYQTTHYHTRDGVRKHVTEWNQEDGLEFLDKRPKQQPFFLTISFFATHAEDGNKERYFPMNSSMPLYVNDTIPRAATHSDAHFEQLPYFFDASNFGRGRYRGRYDTPQTHQKMMKNMYRMATEVDTACGNIIKKLDEQGVTNNTLVIFTTDNGNFHGEHGLAEKWYAYEESIRVPLIIKDPRMPPSKIGTSNDEFTLNIDLAPTMLSAAGIPVPSAMQGRDMADLYLRNATDWRQEFLYEYWGEIQQIPNSLALVRKGSKYIYWTDYNYSQYFDLVMDPIEENDIHNVTDPKLLQEIRNRLGELHELAKAGESELSRRPSSKGRYAWMIMVSFVLSLCLSRDWLRCCLPACLSLPRDRDDRIATKVRGIS